MWIGIDDTDSKNGGCTTYIAREIIKTLDKEKYDIIGYPRLVRLNPNIPWKTRGNGAICLRVGRGYDKGFEIGRIKNKKIEAYSKKSKKKLALNDIKKIKKKVKEIIQKLAEFEDNKTNPGIVFSNKKPPFSIYNKTVKEIVSLDKTKEILLENKIDFEGYKNSRGLIGAIASIAWEPKSDTTYELITYRCKERWGTNRNVNNLSVIEMDKNYSSTFDNYDYSNKHNRIAPNSPCPILYGIRGDIPNELIKARALIKSERFESWILFESNQGTDDHLQRTKIKDIKPFQSVIISGRISKNPITIRGGHVLFELTDNKIDNIFCAAYEPTKHFRNIIKKLIINDEVSVYGGIREKPLTINIEKIKINKLAKKLVKIENPRCPKCGKHMKSKGTGKNFKCKNCKTYSDKSLIIEQKREIKLGFYEVPVCARRHLSKPLKRITLI